MREPQISDEVHLHVCSLKGVITAKFYFSDVSDITKIDVVKADKMYPGWSSKPMYVICLYSEPHIGEKCLAFYDELCFASELN